MGRGRRRSAGGSLEQKSRNDDKSMGVSTQKRSIPPASPHRAGHYAGLHPEDQPYQSTFMAVQPALTSAYTPKAEGHGQKTRSMALPAAESVVNSAEELQSVQTVALQRPFSTSPLSMPKKEEPRGRGSFVPVTLTISFLILLIASSLLVYIYINRKPLTDKQVLSVVPNQLRVNDSFLLSGNGFGPHDLISFTHDQQNEPILDSNGKPLQTHADDRGTFALKIMVPTTWQVGQHAIFAIDIGREQSVSVMATVTVEQSSSAPPHLELDLVKPTLDMGMGEPGLISQQTLTLMNGGGLKVSWQASSDQPWLTVSPGNGSFSGSQVVQIIANRGTLPPQSYAGHITFRQQGSSDVPLTLTVTMAVKAAPPASLTVSPVALTYVGTATQSPVSQSITLQNNGGQALDWSGSIGNSATWLTISPTRDHLAAHSSETVVVNVQSQQMAVGSYQGTINFSGGANPQVTVNLTVVAPGNVIASPPSLTFSAAGQNVLSQPLTLQNSGGQPLDWTVSAATADGANWLSSTPANGHLEANQSATVTVSVNAAALKPRAYQGTLTFSYGGLSSSVAVALTVSVPPAAAISLNQSALSFTTIKGINPGTGQFMITNSGNATLNWGITEDQNGKAFILVSPTSGSLAPTKSSSIILSPLVSQATGGTVNAVITVFDTDVGTKVASQKVNVSILVKDQAAIGVSVTTLPTFNHTSQLTSSTQSFTITNTGSQPLNWTLQANATWLSFDLTNGSLQPGESVGVTVTCDSSALTPGTYPASIVISDSDTGTPVTPQTVNVQLVVS